MRVTLTVAGSDSGGGAGIQADLKAMSANGVFAASVITAVTAQNTVEVRQAYDLPVALIAAQLDAVLDDLPVAAIKTGMLSSGAIVAVVSARLRRADVPLVVDPVMVSKGGHPLLAPDAVAALVAELLPLAHLVTPNVPEAERLAGMTLATDADVREAARRIHALGPRAVLVKGGHRGGADSTDVLFDGRGFHAFTAPRVDTTSTHGTGCTYASAITAWLAQGADLPAAIGRAKTYVTGAIAHGLAIGSGHGPVDHFWAYR